MKYLLLIMLVGCTLKNFNHNMLIVSNASIACDYGQTMRGFQMGIPETNPILGDHPSTAKLTAYNAIAITLNTAAYYATGKIDEKFKWVVPMMVLFFAQLPTIVNNATVIDRPVCGLY